jgi:hypothetical protein
MPEHEGMVFERADQWRVVVCFWFDEKRCRPRRRPTLPTGGRCVNSPALYYRDHLAQRAVADGTPATKTAPSLKRSNTLQLYKSLGFVL